MHKVISIMNELKCTAVHLYLKSMSFCTEMQKLCLCDKNYAIIISKEVIL